MVAGGLRLEVSNEDRRTIVHQLVVDVNYVSELDRAYWAAGLHGFFDGSLNQNLIDARKFLLRLVLAQLRHDPMPPSSCSLLMNVGVLHKIAETVN